MLKLGAIVVHADSVHVVQTTLLVLAVRSFPFVRPVVMMPIISVTTKPKKVTIINTRKEGRRLGDENDRHLSLGGSVICDLGQTGV